MDGGRDICGVSIVVPTVGRPSLTTLLTALATQEPAGAPLEILLVDDRRRPTVPLDDAVPAAVRPYVKVVRGPGRGPAAARNAGWSVAGHPWVAFLDDDVVPDDDWLADLVADLAAAELAAAAGERVGGVQGRLRVPLPAHRPPTDWERVTAGLAEGVWITADMAYRDAALADAGGFDERFPRAFREDADLAYRVRAAGWTLVHGRRQVTHPVRPEGPWVSLRTQRGNADDALLRRRYGPRWRRLLEAPPGRRRRHAVVTAAAAAAVGCAVVGLAAAPRAGDATAARGRAGRGWRIAAALAATGWLAGTAEFAAARIRPGPRTPAEVATMAATSALIPPLAVGHWLRGWWRWRHVGPAGAGVSGSARRR